MDKLTLRLAVFRKWRYETNSAGERLSSCKVFRGVPEAPVALVN